MIPRTKHAVIAVVVVFIVLVGVLFGVMAEKAGGVRFGVEHLVLNVATVYDSYSVLVLGEDRENERVSMREFLINRLGDRVSDYNESEEEAPKEVVIKSAPVDVNGGITSPTVQPLSENGTTTHEISGSTTQSF